MMPTQLTVFTRVCACVANKSPMSALNMATGLTKKHDRINCDRQAEACRLQPGRNRRVDCVCSCQITWLNAMRDEHFGAMAVLTEWIVGMPPIHGVNGVK